MVINFLLGAGISNPVSIKQTWEITDIILSGEKIVRGTAENYYFDFPENYKWDIFQEKKGRVIKLLDIVKQDYDKYYKKYGYKTNYESLYYFINFIHQELSGGLENHAVHYYLEKQDENIKKLLEPIEQLIEINKTELFKETENYITWVLFNLLGINISNYNHLNFLMRSIEDPSIKLINVFTLNNDTVLEQCFEKKGVDYIDGFKINSSDDYEWDVTTFENRKKKVHLIKNHGSINWFHEDRADWYNNRIIKNRMGKTIRDIDLPIFLIGTFNKERGYLNRLFLEIFYTFYRKLNESDFLIISGYSFGDKAVNEKIIDWYYGSHSRKILIIHPNFEELKKHSRPSIVLRWRDWEETDKRLFTIEKRIEQTSWNDIKSKLNLD